MSTKNPKLRKFLKPNYQNDANFFHRLADSVIDDEEKDIYWRTDVVNLLKRLAIMFERINNEKKDDSS